MKRFAFTLLVLLTNTVFPQDTLSVSRKNGKDYQKWNLNYSVSVLFQKNLFGEIGINYGKFSLIGPCGGGQTILLRATTEFTAVDKELLFAPKIGFEMSLITVMLIRLSVVNYNYRNINDTRFISEIGIGSRGLSLLYGWNIPFDNNKKQDYVSNNRFGLTINF